MTPCPYCNEKKGAIEVHGSMMCCNCGTKIVGCCGDGSCLL